jgi:hypothetical protein
MTMESILESVRDLIDEHAADLGRPDMADPICKFFSDSEVDIILQDAELRFPGMRIPHNIEVGETIGDLVRSIASHVAFYIDTGQE